VGLQIRSLRASAGYLENAPIELAPGLTCVIGARGTCKSTIVETIRYVFDCDRKRVAALLGKKDPDAGPDVPSYFGLVKATLGAGVARCELVETDGAPLTVEREGEDAPRVLRHGVRDLSAAGVLDKIEIYSQGDLQRIAEDGARRLDLIDRPNRARIDALLAERRDAARGLKEVGSKLRSLRASIDARRADLKALPTLAAQLRQLQEQRPRLSPELDSERKGHLERRRLLERARSATAKRLEVLGAMRALATSEAELRAAAQELRTSDVAPAKALASVLDGAAELVSQTKRSADSLAALDSGPLLEELRARFDELDRGYVDLQRQEQTINESLRAEDKLRQQIGALEKLDVEVSHFRKQEQELLRERERCRQKIAEVGDCVFALRRDEVDRINARFEGVIRLTLTQATRTTEYRALLDRLLQGSGLRNQKEIARDLVAKVPPFQLVDAVETGDGQLLAAHLERDAAQMARLIAQLLDSPALHEVEAVPFDDQLEITLFVDGVEKPVQQLSKGQMATALLPLLLRPADYPLIFDQPEDDLDNRYVYQTLVTRIRELKRTRQLIFVTHNANIPVLGDAERVVVMQMESPTKAAAPRVGAVEEAKDSILGLLEGGAEAFKERQRRYGSLVT
jgi:hypothetical protein